MSKINFTKSHVLYAFVILSCSATSSSSDIYKYVDSSGSVCMTNKFESVPKKHRSSMTVVKEDVSVKQKQITEVKSIGGDQSSSVASQEQAQAQKISTSENGNKNKYIRTALIVAGIIAGYFIVTRLTVALGFPKVGVLLFLFLILVGGVYLYGIYLNEMQAAYNTLRQGAIGMKKNVEQREQKTDLLLKQLPEKD